MLPDLRRDSRDGVVVVRLDPEDPRRLNGPEASGLRRPKRDRDLPDQVAGAPLADDPLDSIDDLDHLDMPLEQSEEPRLVSLVYRVFSGAEADVGRNATEPLAVGGLESRESLEPPDFLRSHHPRHRGLPEQSEIGTFETASTPTRALSNFVPSATGTNATPLAAPTGRRTGPDEEDHRGRLSTPFRW